MILSVLVANLFVAGLSAFSLAQSWNQLQGRAESSTRNLAQVLEEEITGDIEKADAALLTVSEEVQRRLAMGRVDRNELNAFIARQLSHLPEIISIRVADENGIVRYGPEASDGKVSIADRKYFVRQQSAATSQLVIEGPVFARISQQWSLPMSRRISRADGGFAGVVYVNLAIQHLINTFRELDLGAHGTASLRDEDFKIVARYPDNFQQEYLREKTTLSPALDALVKAGQVDGTYRAKSVLDGVERTYSFRKVDRYPLYVTVGFARSDYMDEWWSNLATLGLWQLLFLTFTVAAARKAHRAWKQQQEAVDSLHNSEERFRYAFESSPVGMAVVSLAGNFLQVNAALCTIVGYERDELKQLTPQAITHPDDLDIDDAPLHQLLSGELSAYKVEKRYVRKDGVSVWVQLTASVVRDASGHPLHFVAQVENISDRRRASEQLALSAKVFEESGECIVITDHEERILSVNKAFSRVTGYQPDEVIGKTPRVMRSGHQEAEFYRNMWSSLRETGYWSGEIWDKRKNGELYPKWLSISAVGSHEGKATHYIGIFSDISERKEAEAHIEFLAYHDALTKLPNRLLAMDHLELAVAHAGRSGKKAAVLFLDLDNFKTVNDSFGHNTGDALLKAVAERLRSCTRATDTVSRQGGDEFLIVIADVPDAEAIAETAEKILDSLENTFEVEGHEISTSLSMGIAVYPDDSKDVASLLKLADTAMYHAKESGRNAFRFYTEEMNVHAIEHHRIRVGLRRALERGEFVLHYQPQIELATGKVVGAEALIRWNHPEQGLLFPGTFIPTAEDSGLIVPIGEWVLREACRQAVAWRDAGLPEILVAINVSATQFRRANFEQSVLDALQESGLPPRLLEIELTESILIQDTEKMLEALQRLKAHGLTLSIDDFGTGYSSLSYLKRFNVDKLKIDRSFIKDMLVNSQDATIVRAIIQLARSLNLRTIAEGVENEHLVTFLQLQYCDDGQGYHFARPMPADEFARYLLAPPQQESKIFSDAKHA